MRPVDVRLDDHTSGDTWQGIPTIGPIVDEATGTTPGSEMGSAELWLYRDAIDTPFKLSTVVLGRHAPINIFGNPANWELSIPPVAAATFPPGVGEWHGKLKITDAAGEKLTYYNITFTAGTER